jgi:hypothetical protein
VRHPLSMNTFLANHKRLFAIIALVLLLPVLLQTWWLTAGTRGQLRARFDLWRGHYAIHTYGLNLSGREYARILRARYGVETHVDALCIVSESQRSYADSYNKLSTTAANRKFGHDVFKECSEEARHEWESRRAQNLGSE